MLSITNTIGNILLVIFEADYMLAFYIYARLIFYVFDYICADYNYNRHLSDFDFKRIYFFWILR